MTWGPLIAKRDPATRRVLRLDGSVAAKGERVPIAEQWLIPDPAPQGPDLARLAEASARPRLQFRAPRAGLRRLWRADDPQALLRRRQGERRCRSLAGAHACAAQGCQAARPETMGRRAYDHRLVAAGEIDLRAQEAAGRGDAAAHRARRHALCRRCGEAVHRADHACRRRPGARCHRAAAHADDGAPRRDVGGGADIDQNGPAERADIATALPTFTVEQPVKRAPGGRSAWWWARPSSAPAGAPRSRHRATWSSRSARRRARKTACWSRRT
jgi:hypothetical protein